MSGELGARERAPAERETRAAFLVRGSNNSGNSRPVGSAAGPVSQWAVSARGAVLLALEAVGGSAGAQWSSGLESSWHRVVGEEERAGGKRSLLQVHATGTFCCTWPQSERRVSECAPEPLARSERAPLCLDTVCKRDREREYAQKAAQKWPTESFLSRPTLPPASL